MSCVSKADGSITQRRYLVAGRNRAGRLSSDQAYAEGLRECLDVRCAGRRAALIRSAACSAAGLIPLRCRRSPPARSARKTNGGRFPGVPRPGFAGAFRPATTATKLLMSRRSRRRPAISTSLMSRNDARDDLAELERFFIALEGPVRNPTNLGWMLGPCGGARARPARAARRLSRQCTISWNGWSQAVTHLMRGRLADRLRQWQMFYRHIALFTLGGAAKAFCRAAAAGAAGGLGRSPPPSSGSRPGTITRRSAPISPLPWRSSARAKKRPRFSLSAAARTNA